MKLISAARRALLKAGFVSAPRGLFVRVSKQYPYLVDHFQISKEQKGYQVTLDVGVASIYSEPELYLIGLMLHAPSCLRHDGVTWSHAEPIESSYWHDNDGADLDVAIVTTALPWFEKWSNPARLIAFLRYVGGEDDADCADEFRRQEIPTRAEGTDWRALFDLYGHTGMLREATTCLEHYVARYRTPLPRNLAWVQQAQEDLRNCALPTRDITRILG